MRLYSSPSKPKLSLARGYRYRDGTQVRKVMGSGLTYLVSSGLPVVPKALGLKETRMFEEPARAGAPGASAT